MLPPLYHHKQPTYDFVCSGFSGHTEAVQVFYDPKEVSFEALCNVLLSRIDPTLKNQVGNDRGTQYRYVRACILCVFFCGLFAVIMERHAKGGVGADTSRTHTIRVFWGRHGIYTHSKEQEAAAMATLKKAQEKYARPVVTECLPAQVYWPAEVHRKGGGGDGGRHALR